MALLAVACGTTDRALRPDVPTWTPGEPVLRVGVVEGDPAYQLHQVRDATLLPDGRLVIVNAGSHEVRIYAPDGSHLVSFGGEGEGPDDLIRPRAVLAEGDSLYVDSYGRVSTWTTDGELLRTEPAEPGYAAAWLEGGRRALARSETVIPDVEGGVARHPFTVQVGSDTLARYPGTQFVRAPSERGILLRAFHFFAQPQMDAHGERVYAASGEERVVDVFQADGTRLDPIRWEGPSLEIRPADRDTLEAGIPVAETFPALSDLHTASDGSLWVREYDRPGDTPGRWLVFQGGELVERVTLAERAELLEAGAGYVVLLERDELDVERVAVYRR